MRQSCGLNDEEIVPTQIEASSSDATDSPREVVPMSEKVNVVFLVEDVPVSEQVKVVFLVFTVWLLELPSWV